MRCGGRQTRAGRPWPRVEDGRPEAWFTLQITAASATRRCSWARAPRCHCTYFFASSTNCRGSSAVQAAGPHTISQACRQTCGASILREGNCHMFRKTALGATAALVIAATVAVVPSPAAAHWGWGGFGLGLGIGLFAASHYYHYGYAPYYSTYGYAPYYGSYGY